MVLLKMFFLIDHLYYSKSRYFFTLTGLHLKEQQQLIGVKLSDFAGSSIPPHLPIHQLWEITTKQDLVKSSFNDQRKRKQTKFSNFLTFKTYRFWLSIYHSQATFNPWQTWEKDGLIGIEDNFVHITFQLFTLFEYTMFKSIRGG